MVVRIVSTGARSLLHELGKFCPLLCNCKITQLLCCSTAHLRLYRKSDIAPHISILDFYEVLFYAPYQ
jgi:hypothetical protein